jgi:hypothetical protein
MDTVSHVFEHIGRKYDTCHCGMQVFVRFFYYCAFESSEPPIFINQPVESANSDRAKQLNKVIGSCDCTGLLRIKPFYLVILPLDEGSPGCTSSKSQAANN